MTIVEYLERVKERLLTDAHVARVEIVRERSTATDGYLRARLELTNQQRLEFSEHVQHTAEGNIQVITYSYHWSDAHDKLICRWDNTPHFPTFPNFPHHVHQGAMKLSNRARQKTFSAYLTRLLPHPPKSNNFLVRQSPISNL